MNIDSVNAGTLSTVLAAYSDYLVTVIFIGYVLFTRREDRAERKDWRMTLDKLADAIRDLENFLRHELVILVNNRS